MRVGVDGRKIPRARELGPLRSLDHAGELGMEGVFFRTVLEMSPTLDHDELRAIRAHADALGLYLEAGLGKVNPYCLPETPEVRAVGDGDTRLGFERMMRACRAIDCTELWVGTATIKSQYTGYLKYDRFRTDVTWSEQLRASEAFLQTLAPVARDLGIHMNIETHEEITTHEVVRLVETVGPDVMGVTFDVANVVQRGEAPVLATERVAPYVRQTHLKDAVLSFAPDSAGVVRQVRPCGQGVVDYDTILPLLARHRPDLTLTIENPNAPVLILIQLFDAVWQAAHPDLTVRELAELVRLTVACDRRLSSGEWSDIATYHGRPWGYPEEVAFIRESAAHVRQVLARHGLAAARPPAAPSGPTASARSVGSASDDSGPGGAGPDADPLHHARH